MIPAIIVSVAVALTGVAEAPVSDMAGRLAWVQEVKSLLPSVQVEDRPAAYRDYANMLVDVGQCHTATEVFRDDASFDPELVVTVMDHAAFLGEFRCAGSLGKLAISRLSSSTSISPLRLAELRMAAGAVIKVGGDEVAGAAVIGDAEAALKAHAFASAPMSNQPSAQTLWRARAGILDIYAGTPYFSPALTQFGQELATNLSRSKTYLPLPVIRGFVMRFAASDRADLVELVASKLWQADRQAIMDAASLARHPEIGDALGNKPKPRCEKGLGTHGSQPRRSERRAAFDRIVDLSIYSSKAAIAARCATLRH